MIRETRTESLGTEDRALVDAARAAAACAHAPYSAVRVGAALALADGRVVSGCNVENASYGLTMCAERVAVGVAVSGGAAAVGRIAVVSDRVPVLMPCGACRQVLAEFASAEVEVLCVAGDDTVRVFTIAELLPDAMGPRDLGV